MCGIMFCKDLCTKVLHMNAIFILFFIDKWFVFWQVIQFLALLLQAHYMYNTLLKLRFSAFLYCIEAEIKRFVAVIKF